jgi:hypothetical protein
MDKYEQLLQYSNPNIVLDNINKYYPGTHLYISYLKHKKYMIHHNGKWIHFGGFNPPMEDFTKHNDVERRERYLKRAMNIKGGDWKDNKYSPNWLSIRLLW